MRNITFYLLFITGIFLVQCQNSAEESAGMSTKQEAVEEAKREAETQKIAIEQKKLAKVITPKMVTMNGTWQSKDNPIHKIEITANRFMEYQNDSLVGNAHFAFYNKCKSMGGIIDTTATDFIVVDVPNTESRCYYVEKLETKELHLVLASEGETMIFKRLK